MASRYLIAILGLSQHRRRCRSITPTLKRGIAQFHQASQQQAVSNAQSQASFKAPYGRQYLPAASQQLLTAGSSVSITVAADPANTTRIVVINNGAASHTPVLSGAAQAAAAGTWPSLPTWLFGFACGSAAATAMTYNYLNPQPAASPTPPVAGIISSTSTATVQHQRSSNEVGKVPTGVSFPGSSSSCVGEVDSSTGSSSSSSSSGSSSSRWFQYLSPGAVWGQLQQFVRLGAGPAHASSAAAHTARQLYLPTPWEDQGLATAVDADLAAADNAAAVQQSSSHQATMMRNSISQAAAAVAPAVVHVISNNRNGSSSSGYDSFSGPQGIFDRPQGSGFIYDQQGYILTNAHVILGTQPAIAGSSPGMHWQQQAGSSSRRSLLRMQHNSSSNATAAAAVDQSSGVTVHLQDGRVFAGHVVALDVASDLAVVCIDAPEPLPACRLGTSHRLSAGDWVVAVGSPFLLRQSVTAGIVSCVERKGSELGLVSSPRTEYIQTDAAINIGNSGGPLINLDGEVIGINNMKAPAAEGLSFAIPIDTVKRLLSEMSRHGYVRRPYVGITMTEVNSSRMAQLRASCPDFPTDVSSGIVVTRVTHGSPAAAAGIKEDDVIVGVVTSADNNSAAGTAAGSSDGLSVGSLADALKAAIGGSLQLRIVREQQRQQQKGKQDKSNSSDSSSSRYMYVTVTVKPVEAPHNG